MPTITLRLSQPAYDAVKRHADADDQSMNAYIEATLDAEDMRRRCTAHDRYLASNPAVVTFSQDWADRNLEDLTPR